MSATAASPPAAAPLATLLEQVAAFWPWEALAAGLAILYLWLVIRQHVGCWAAGIASTLIYGVLFLRAALYAAALLQLFYVAVAVYGWWQWSRPARPLVVSRWPLRRQLQAALLVVVAGLVHGTLLARFTDAALPFVDALLAWAAVCATWMVARKLLENWLWWFAIDSLSIWLYAQRGLWLTVLLFMAYLLLIIRGYASWRRELPAQPA